MVARIEGLYYEPGSSRSSAAILLVGERGELEVRSAHSARSYPKSQYSIEPPLGSLDRVIHFADEARFETKDFEAFAKLERTADPRSALQLVDWLERSWKGAIASLVLLVVLSAVFLEWGVPLIAKRISDDMPQSWRRVMTDKSIEAMLDLGYLKPTALEEEDAERMRGLFQRALSLAGADAERFDYQLRLYQGGGAVGANAFAFPSGAVVATDQFIGLCETDEQAIAVFLHEIAHVERQHGIRALIQKTSVYFLFSVLLGDASSVITLAEGLPALLMDSRYSQKFEIESDTFAARALLAGGIAPEAMSEILVLLHRGAPDVPIADLISSHPSLRKRLENIQQTQLRPQE